MFIVIVCCSRIEEILSYASIDSVIPKTVDFKDLMSVTFVDTLLSKVEKSEKSVEILVCIKDCCESKVDWLSNKLLIDVVCCCKEEAILSYESIELLMPDTVDVSVVILDSREFI